VSYELDLEAHGVAAPVLNAFLESVLPRAIGDLGTRLSERLELPDGTASSL
jgi:hypothetical protein